MALVDHLLEQASARASGGRLGVVREAPPTLRTAIPDGLRAVIEPRLERLTHDELRVLEAASVAGPEFAAHAVARAAPPASDLGDVEVVEQLCDVLARRQEILRAAGESAWPDGTTSARYAFRHALYQQVIYQRLVAVDPATPPPDDRRDAGGRPRRADPGDRQRARGALRAQPRRRPRVRYREEAAAQRGHAFAYREVRLHLEAALALLRTQPETAERLRQEMPLLHALGSTLFAIRGLWRRGRRARLRALA